MVPPSSAVARDDAMNVADSISLRADETPFAAAVVDHARIIHDRDLDHAVWHAAA
jgi:hypothetical protein